MTLGSGQLHRQPETRKLRQTKAADPIDDSRRDLRCSSTRRCPSFLCSAPRLGILSRTLPSDFSRYHDGRPSILIRQKIGEAMTVYLMEEFRVWEWESPIMRRLRRLRIVHEGRLAQLNAAAEPADRRKVLMKLRRARLRRSTWILPPHKS